MFADRHSDKAPKVEFKSVGRNQASTFTGMCSQHDQEIFRPLDTKPFDLGDREQLFLLAYRSVTHELHCIMEAAAKIQSGYMSRVERGLDPKDGVSPAGLVATQQLINCFLTYEYRVNSFDGALHAQDFDAIEHDHIVLDQQTPAIAASSLFSLDEIPKDDDVVRVVLNIFPVHFDRTLAIFSYAKDDASKARARIDRILTTQGAYQKYELSKLILGSVENFLISPAHFDSWHESKRERIKTAFVSTLLTGSMEPEERPELMLF